MTKIYYIKLLYLNDQITYDEARRRAEPHIKDINDMIKKVAKIRDRKPVLLTFTSIMYVS